MLLGWLQCQQQQQQEVEVLLLGLPAAVGAWLRSARCWVWLKELSSCCSCLPRPRDMQQARMLLLQVQPVS
jgi:hypothetical protein